VKKITIEEALAALQSIEKVDYKKSGIGATELGNIYNNAAQELLTAINQDNVTIENSEYWHSVLEAYETAAAHFLKAISETNTIYDAIEQYLATEVRAAGIDFALHKTLRISPELIINIDNVNKLLAKFVAPYAAGELLLKNAASCNSRHPGLARTLYDLADAHFSAEIAHQDVSLKTLQLYKKTLEGCLKVADIYLDDALTSKDQTRIFHYSTEKVALEKRIANISAPVTGHCFMRRESNKNEIENVTPRSRIKQRNRPL
jgi:hypothetical protein